MPSSTVSHGHTAADTLGHALLWLQGSLLTQLASNMFWWCTAVAASLTAGTMLLAVIGSWRQRRRQRHQTQWHPELVTVLIAAFKEEKVIERTVRRIFQWEYPFALQLVVVNDGSPRGTGAILDRLAAEYSSGHQQLLVQDRTLGATSARPAGSARRPVWPDTEHVADTERNVSSQTTFGGLHSPRRRAGE